MNHYIHLRSTFKLPLDETQCSLAFLSIIIHGGLKFLAKLIYGNKLVKYLHSGINKYAFESYEQVFQCHQRSLSSSVYLQFQTINCQFDL